MRMLMVLCFLVTLATLACGPTQADVDRIVAEAVAESEARMRVEFEAAADEAKEYIADNIITMDSRLDDELQDHRHYIDTKAVEFKDLVDNRAAQYQGYADSAVLGLENRMDAALRDSRRDAEARASESARVVGEERAALNARVGALTPSICESDYWLVTLWSAYLDLLDKLEADNGRLDATALEHLRRWGTLGVLIDREYADYSTVCDVDSSGRWELLTLPSAVEHEIDR